MILLRALKVNRLLEIGFEPAGHWILDNEKIRLELIRHSSQVNILYAFICDSDVMYVGKTKRTLLARMSNYLKPHESQRTNIKNYQNIISMPKRGSSVEILALPDNGLMHYGKFHLNLAAALEDDIIRVIDPKWNGGKTDLIENDGFEVTETIPPILTGNFSFILENTYFERGFFNVSVSQQKYIGADGEKIELFLGSATQPVLGTINRRANLNNTPRVMGSTKLRGWFKSNSAVKQEIFVQVYSPTAIRLTAL